LVEQIQLGPILSGITGESDYRNDEMIDNPAAAPGTYRDRTVGDDGVGSAPGAARRGADGSSTARVPSGAGRPPARHGPSGAGRPENRVQARSMPPQKKCTGLTLPTNRDRNAPMTRLAWRS